MASALRAFFTVIGITHFIPTPAVTVVMGKAAAALPLLPPSPKTRRDRPCSSSPGLRATSEQPGLFSRTVRDRTYNSTRPLHERCSMAPTSLLDRLAAAKLGATRGDIEISNAEENRIAALQLVSQARHTLCIYSRHLDATIYSTGPFAEAVTQLAIRSRHSQVRILVQDSTPLVQQGHRLVELSYRLSSRVQIRKPAEEFKEYNEAFLIVDEQGLLHRRHADRYEAIVNFCAAGAAAPLLKYFNHVWNMSEPDPNLRRLDL